MSDQLFSVFNQNVLITGGSRRIGRAIAEGFASRGANVLIRSRESVDAAVREMQDAGLSASGLSCDVSDPEQIQPTVWHSRVPGIESFRVHDGPDTLRGRRMLSRRSWPIPLS